MKKSIVLTLALTAAEFVCASLPDPVIWYKMDKLEGGKILDQSGNGYDLTLGATVTQSQVAVGIDAALLTMPTIYFDGTTNAWSTFQQPANMTSRTMTCWIWREKLDCEHINEPGYEVTYIPYLLTGPMNLQFNTVDGSANGIQTWFQAVSPETAVYPSETLVSPSRQTLHLLTWVIAVDAETSNATLTIYIDGYKHASANCGVLPTRFTTETSNNLGNNAVRGKRPIHGHIGEFALYDAALTADQVNEIYQSAASGAMIAAWNMDETATESGVRYVPSMTGTGPRLKLGDNVQLVDAPDGKALWFNPTSETIAKMWAASDDLNCPTRSYSWSAWVNISSLCTNTYLKRVVSPSGKTNNIPRIVSFSETSNTRFMINDGSGTSYGSTSAHYYLGNSSPYQRYADAYAEKDTWFHVAAVNRLADGECKFKFYINGELRTDWYGESCSLSTLLKSNSTVFLGNDVTADNNGASRCLSGTIDDVRVYNGILTDDQIREIYRGPAAVDAGADFSTAEATTTLRGTVGKNAGVKDVRSGYAGTIAWALVSSPEGGEGAAFEQVSAAVTRVTLPVVGEYVFELRSSAMGAVRKSRVTVTRVAEQASNQAPTVNLGATTTTTLFSPLTLAAAVADPDSAPGTLRTSWKKVSGPEGGAVYFSEQAATTEAYFSAAGAYVLRCTACDGQDSASATITVSVTESDSFDVGSLTNGLYSYFKFNGNFNNEISGREKPSLAGFNAGVFNQHLVTGIDGLGYRCMQREGTTADAMTFTKTFWGEPDGTGTMPTNRYNSVSMWIYHDPAYVNPSRPVFRPALIYKRCAFDLEYLEMDESLVGSKSQGAVSATLWRGFQIFQAWGGPSFLPPAVPLTNRWAHVYALFDRQAEKYSEDTSEVWVDGVKLVSQAAASFKSRGSSYVVAIGGAHSSIFNETWNTDYTLTNKDYYTSRTFPGIIDEVRLYQRKLTPEEIRYLAQHPRIDEPAAPTIDTPEESLTTTRGQQLAFAAEVNGDPMPISPTYTYKWEVIGGDASNVTFASASERSTSATFRKTGDYALQLVVTDGLRKTVSDPLRVTIRKAGMVMFLE